MTDPQTDGLVERLEHDLASVVYRSPGRSSRPLTAVGKDDLCALIEQVRTLQAGLADTRAGRKLISSGAMDLGAMYAEVVAERDSLQSDNRAAVSLLERATKEAVPDAMIFAAHTDPHRYGAALDDLRSWTAEARTFIARASLQGRKG